MLIAEHKYYVVKAISIYIVTMSKNKHIIHCS